MGRLFWKIFLVIWLALLGASWLTGWVVWLRFQTNDSSLILDTSPRSGFLMDAAAAVLESQGPSGLAAWMSKVRSMHPELRSLHAVDAAGHSVGDNAPSPDVVAFARTRATQATKGPQGAAPARATTDSLGQHWVLFVSDEHHPPPPLDLGRPLPGEPHGPPDGPGGPPAIERLWPLLSAGLVMSLLCSTGLAAYLTRPLRTLREGFEAMEAGRLDVRIGQSVGHRRDEVADLVRDFDRMASRLDKLVQAQTRLLHDVSHELRSPLARMQIGIDLAGQNPARTGEAIARVEKELERLNLLVGDVLDFSRLEASSGRQATEAIDLATLVADIVADADFEARAADKRVTLAQAEGVAVQGHADLMARAIENVVRNAVKFSRTGTEIAVALTRADGQARLRVRDHGPGVPADMLARIFEPFACTGLQRESEGSGLGLAIVARAMQLDAGHYQAANLPNGGLEVTLSWPCAPLATPGTA